VVRLGDPARPERDGATGRPAVAGWVLAAAAAGALIAGCGSTSHTEAGNGGGGGDEQGQANALSKIPAADQAAFVQIATVIGTLRVRAAPVAIGKADRLASAAPLRDGRSRVAALRPRDPRLMRLRDQLIPALTRFIRAPTSGAAARRAARGAIADADRIEARLRRYARVQPAVGALIPD